MNDPKDAGVSLPGGVRLEAEAPAPSPRVDPRDAGKWHYLNISTST